MTIPSEQPRRPGRNHLLRWLLFDAQESAENVDAPEDENRSPSGAPSNDAVASASFSSLSKPEEKPDAPAAEKTEQKRQELRLNADVSGPDVAGSLTFDGLASLAQRQQGGAAEAPSPTGKTAPTRKMAEDSFSSDSATQTEKTNQAIDEYVAASRKQVENKSSPPRLGDAADLVGGSARFGRIVDWTESQLGGEPRDLARHVLGRPVDTASLPYLASLEKDFTNATDQKLAPVDEDAVRRGGAVLNEEMAVIAGNSCCRAI